MNTPHRTLVALVTALILYRPGASRAEPVTTPQAPAPKAVASAPTALTLREKLETIVLPKLAAEEKAARDVFALIQEQARKYDPMRTGVNLIYQCPPTALAKTVTIDFDRVPLGQAIDYLCRACGLQMHLDEHTVVILPRQGN